MAALELNFKNQLLEIWRLRMLQQRSEAVRRFESLHADQFNLPSDRLLSALLKVSFYRAEGKLHEADLLLSQVENDKYLLPSKFYHQKGLQEIVQLKYAAALESFILAAEYADSLFDRILAESGVLSCLYNISQPCIKKLRTLDRLLAECQDQELVDYMKSFIDHWSIRSYFGHGEIKKALEYKALPGTQSHYLQLWIRSLPYVGLEEKITHDELSEFLAIKDFHLKSVRVTTLTGDLKFDSHFKTSNMSEYIDRLYLWLWNWLLQPSEQRFHLLNTALQQVLTCAQDSQALLQQRDEDLDILETCLKWCALFNELFALRIAPLEKILAGLSKASNPRMRFEKTLIEKIKALKKSNQIKKIFSASDDPIFSLQQDLWNENAVKIVNHIQSQKKNSAIKVVIDPNAGFIRIDHKVHYSELLAKAAAIAFQNESSPFSDFFPTVFGYKDYSFEEHSQKIHNFLNRLKKLFKNKLLIRTRQEIIFFEVAPELLKTVSIVDKSHDFSALQEVFNFENLASSQEKKLRTLTPQLILRKAQGKSRFSRHELEKILGLSKASTQRWIQKWEKEGIVSRMGEGKSSLYFITLGEKIGDKK